MARRRAGLKYHCLTCQKDVTLDEIFEHRGHIVAEMLLIEGKWRRGQLFGLTPRTIMEMRGERGDDD